MFAFRLGIRYWYPVGPNILKSRRLDGNSYTPTWLVQTPRRTPSDSYWARPIRLFLCMLFFLRDVHALADRGLGPYCVCPFFFCFFFFAVCFFAVFFCISHFCCLKKLNRNKIENQIKIQIGTNFEVATNFKSKKFQIGTNFKSKQISNWKNFQIKTNFKSKQISKLKQISSWNKFRNLNKN
jgi:hypothetical protein